MQTAPAGSADKLYLLPVDAKAVEKVIHWLATAYAATLVAACRSVVALRRSMLRMSHWATMLHCAVEAKPLRSRRWHASRRAL